MREPGCDAAGAGTRPRIVCGVYSCSPGRGSEPGAGWHRVIQAARFFDTVALVRQDPYERVIRAWLAEYGPVAGLEFRFVRETRLERLLRRAPYLRYVACNLWQRRAYRVARQLHRQRPFALAHQITWSSYREPGYLWKLDVPFVWGPVGGTESYPRRFYRGAGLSCRAREGLRSLLNAVQLRCSRRVRTAARRASLVLAANGTVAGDFRRVLGVTTGRASDVGVNDAPEAVRLERGGNGPLRILFSGVLEHRKGLHLLLQALAGASAGFEYELCVLGDGPQRRRWQRLAERLGVARHCRWLGQRPLAEALRAYDEADVFVFPSLRDTGGTVVPEALVRGLPVICLDHHGAGEFVTEACGIRVPVTTPAEVAAGLREALEGLARDPGRLAELSRGARERGLHFLWPRKGERMAKVYECTLARRETAPGAEPAGERFAERCGGKARL